MFCVIPSALKATKGFRTVNRGGTSEEVAVDHDGVGRHVCEAG